MKTFWKPWHSKLPAVESTQEYRIGFEDALREALTVVAREQHTPGGDPCAAIRALLLREYGRRCDG